MNSRKTAANMREWITGSRPLLYLTSLTATQTVIAGGLSVMGLGGLLLLGATLSFIVASLTASKLLLAGIGSLALTLEGFGVVILSSEFIE